MNILIIEDDLPLANVLAAMMRRFAKKVVIAGSLRIARDVLSKPNGFDLVLLDLNLPDSTTVGTMHDIQQIKGTGRKVVVMTGTVSNVDEFAEASGADGCFYKHDPDFLEKMMAQIK